MKQKFINFIPFVILILGIILRLIYAIYFGPIAYAQDYSIFYYTHDTGSHVEYINFVAKNLNIPSPEKGLEFPQQPLYYIVAGGIYNFLSTLSFSNNFIFTLLVLISTLSSAGTLIFAYLLSKKITKNIWSQSFITGVIAFTPSFIYQAGMLGNDPFCAFLSAASFYFLVRFIQEEKNVDLIATTFFSVFSVFTKMSAGIIMIIILLALIWKYYSENKEIFLKMIYIVFFIGFMSFSMMLYRSYIPSENRFLFVESYSFDGQQTNPSRPSYFLNFYFPSLLKEGQSFVYGNEKISKTFPTFLYGSFLFGEYSFANITTLHSFIKIIMQIIIIFGLLLPIGIIANLFFIKKWMLIDFIFAIGVGMNAILIINFLSKYPSVCNSDFRYFMPTLLPIAALSGMGILRLNEKLKIKWILPALCAILISLEFLWIIIRIYIKIFKNI